ncbi:unnamed protein product [Miscanthus lutarioriparius]|uniref:Uncharacterized protein n=1 Tax=Miscanthus lutarioriparius TaxID=422564 RepID=A0A811QJ94_9POAL|nr:unnamed protein product [Miscanthus lutarioriparius]
MRRGETDATEWALNYVKEKAPELLSVMACSEVPMDLQLCKAAEEGRSCFADQKCSASALALQNIVKKLIKTELENSVACWESGSDK